MTKKFIFSIPEELNEKLEAISKKFSLSKSAIAKISINKFCDGELKL